MRHVGFGVTVFPVSYRFEGHSQLLRQILLRHLIDFSEFLDIVANRFHIYIISTIECLRLTVSIFEHKMQIYYFHLGAIIKSNQKEILLTQIGENIATEIDSVKSYKYLPNELGYVIRLTMKDNEVIILSLI